MQATTDPSLETDATLDAMFDSLLNSTTTASTTTLPIPTLQRHTAGGPYPSVEKAAMGGTPADDIPNPPVLHRTYTPMCPASSSNTNAQQFRDPTTGLNLDSMSMQDITGVFEDLDHLDQADIPDFPEVMMEDRARLQPTLNLCAVSEDIKALYPVKDDSTANTTNDTTNNTTNNTSTTKSSTQYTTDAGYDLHFTETVTVAPGETVMCDFGVSVQAHDEDNAPCASEMLPRSSIVKTPLRMANSVGLIDASYRGTLRVYVDNIRSEPYTIQKGDRLFQLVAPSRRPFVVSFVDALSETDRGENGFGSTGK